MKGQSDHRGRLASLLGEIAVEEGMQRTLVEGVEVLRASKPVPRAPIVYQPRILIVGQGRKRAYLGGETYQYDAYNYLVLSVPLPAECETEASPEEPLFLLAIHVEPSMMNFGEVAPTDVAASRAITVRSNDLKMPEKFQVTKVESSLSTITTALKPTSNKGEFEVTLQVAKDAKPGDVEGTVKIYTNDQINPVVTVPVKATVKAGAKAAVK